MRNRMLLGLWKADMEQGATFPVCETYTASSWELRNMKWKLVDHLSETDIIKGVTVDVSRTPGPSPPSTQGKVHRLIFTLRWIQKRLQGLSGT